MLKQKIRPSEENIPKRNEGYIIDYKEIYDYSIDENENSVTIYAIAIGHNPKTYQFVTWEYKMYVKDQKKSESFFWGHYFYNEYNAKVDYHERLSNYYRLHTVDFKGED